MLKKFIFLYNLSESELKVFNNYTKESIISLDMLVIEAINGQYRYLHR